MSHPPSSNSCYNYTVPKAKSDLFACGPTMAKHKSLIFNLTHYIIFIYCIIFYNGSLTSNAISSLGHRVKQRGRETCTFISGQHEN